MRTTFDWSWNLLPDHEKAALAQLTAFERGMTLEAAEAVLELAPCGASPSRLDAVQSLVEKSWLRHGADGRFDLLRTVQEYATEHLTTPGRFPGSGPEAAAAAQRRHLGYFAALGAARAVAHSCADLDNLVTATRRAVRLIDATAAAGALEGAWAALRLRGPFRAGLELAQTVLAMPGLPPAAAAHAGRIAGWAASLCGRSGEAAALLETALAHARKVGDRSCEGCVLGHLGDMHVNEGDMEGARRELETALGMARETGDASSECAALSGLGTLHERLGRWDDARTQYDAALRLAREIGERRWEGGCLGNLGVVDAAQGRAAAARAHYEEALVVVRELGERQWEGNTLCNLGLLHQEQGRLPEAKATLDEALALAREIGSLRLECVVSCNLGLVHQALRVPAEAAACFESAVAVARALGDRRAQGQFLYHLGLLHLEQRHSEDARRCLAAGELLLRQVEDRASLALLLCGLAECERSVGRAEAADAAFDEARSLAAQLDAGPDSELRRAIERAARPR